MTGRRINRRLMTRLAGCGGMAIVLALVFAAYLQPDLMVDLANRVWSCF
jgi:hypothetical protein